MFVAIRLVDYIDQINFSEIRLLEWIIFLGFAIFYGIINIALVIAWRNILSFLGSPLKFHKAVYIYGMSQLAKYVPGNIFHLAGRQALGMAAGLPGWVLAKSTFWELGLIAFTGTLFGLLALPLWWETLPSFFFIIVFGIIVLIVGLVVRFFFNCSLIYAFIWYLLFLAMTGLVFYGVLSIITPFLSIKILFGIVGAYVIAWLAGLITPGAPAGVGVREFVLLFLLTGVIGEGDLLLAISLGRIITVIGDSLFFGGTMVYHNLWLRKGELD